MTEAQGDTIILLLQSIDSQLGVVLAYGETIEWATTAGVVATSFLIGLVIWQITHRALSCKRWI